MPNKRIVGHSVQNIDCGALYCWRNEVHEMYVDDECFWYDVERVSVDD